ncbi:tetratricopeptide repeat-containing sulfotransferase family protein [Undibacterium sp. Ji50W]|uniref:tetratricopeptide repeat-containing sulfotransferase family protein n=1 Tax=Undibacterium sp. Ji50W TaxID=3413041 RepID=UPI003BEFA0DD
MTTAMNSQLQQLDRHLRHGEQAAAAVLCQQIIAAEPQSLSLHLTASQVWQRLGKFDAMLDMASKAVALSPFHPPALLREVESLVYCGQIAAAREKIKTLEQLADNDAALLQDVAHMYLHCAAHLDAARCYERAVALQPDQALYLFNLASSCVTTGELSKAETLFNRVIALDPADFGACLNRSMLKTWKPEQHHIAQLEQLLLRLPKQHPGEVPLCYALAKEHEDLGDATSSFQYLKRGALRRRNMLAYKGENDVAAMKKIRQTFTAELFSSLSSPQPSQLPTTTAERALFVLGLPRSGTTLVERILSSHSQVGSLGEINNLAFAIMQMAAGPGNKLDMIERSAHINMSQLREIYQHGIAGYGNDAPWLINKTPENYLYLGLIHQAMPHARIIHLRRHPLDSCYAMYKTLFRMGYPFSYSLEDLGHYYLAYHQLMQHWREVLPGRFLDIDYEVLVDQQESSTRAMLAYCDLPWEDACLDFHNNTAPAATASAAQVRQPLYRSSVQRWRSYEEQLAPLAAFLTEHGINCD